jgi:quercetin dioxygenase-like cupin family protein
MKSLSVAALPLALLVSSISLAAEPAASTVTHKQVVIRAGSQASIKGGADAFTGDVRIDPLFPAGAPASFSGGAVSFEPGARSAWHTHPAGQYLIVTKGVGRTQQRGGPVVELHLGDVVWCPPGVEHWHGAAPVTGMTHLALTGTVDNKNVTWLEKVTDDQYNAR